MIAIDVTRCTGCGACVEVCPTGALYLVDGKATVDEALCRECEACLDACPCEAITLTTGRVSAPEAARVPVPRRDLEVIRVKTPPAPLRSGTMPAPLRSGTMPAPLRSGNLPEPLPLRSRTLPVLGAALAWAGREIVPRLIDIFMERLDRPASPAARQGTNVARRGGSGGRQETRGSGRRRRRRRGGRSM